MRTITLDDLLAVISFSRALVKFDIEGDEAKVMLNSTSFLEVLQVPYILMEWIFAASAPGDTTHALLRFMRERHYSPFSVSRTRLAWEQWKDWPDNILWVRSLAHL